MKKLLFILPLFFCFFVKAQTITYTPLGASGYRIKYLVGDSGVAVPFRDTTIGRGINRPGPLVINPADSLPYYYNGIKWKALFIDSAGVLSIAKDKVDSITYTGITAYYWVNGTGFGKQYLDTSTANTGITTLYQNGLHYSKTQTDSIAALKVNITDTTNKWVANVTAPNDSTIRVFKGGSSSDLTIRGSAHVDTSLLVHKANDETINGVKTFADTLKVKQVYLKDSNFVIPSVVTWLGDSYTSGYRPDSPDTTFVTRLSGSQYGYNLTSTNYGLSGSGVWNMLSQFNQNINPTYNGLTSAMGGFNDLRRSASSLTQLKILEEFQGIICNHFLKSYVAAGSGSATRSGTWTTTYPSSSVGGKGGSNGAYTTTLNDYVTYTFTDSTIVVGLFATDNSYGTANYAKFDVYIDNVLKGHYDENNRTDGVSDGVYDNKRIPWVLMFNGLTLAQHTIKLINKSATGTAYLVVDYFGNLKDASKSSPLLLWHIPYVDSTGYAASPNSSSISATKTMNFLLDSLVLSWKTSYPIYTVKTENFYDTLSCLASDHIHPSNYGDSILTNAALSVLPSLTGTYFGTNLFAGTKRPFVITNKVRQDLATLSDINTISSALMGIVSAPISGLTTGYFTKASSPTTIVNSLLFDNGTSLGLGTITPSSSSLFDIYASANPMIQLDNSTTNSGFLTTGASSVAFAANRNPKTGTFVNNGSAASEILLNSSSGNGAIDFYTSNTNNTAPSLLFKFDANGMSYGTGVTPTAALDIVGTQKLSVPISGAGLDISSSSNPMLQLDYSTTNSGYLIAGASNTILVANRNPKTGTFTNTGAAASQIALNSASGNGAIDFYTSNTNNTSPTLKFKFDVNGLSFGTGTTATTALDIAGGGKFTEKVFYTINPTMTAADSLALADKEYVDAHSGGADSTTASNGLTLSGKDVQLGGSLTGNTSILTSSHNLSLTGSPGSLSEVLGVESQTTNPAIQARSTPSSSGVKYPLWLQSTTNADITDGVGIQFDATGHLGNLTQGYFQTEWNDTSAAGLDAKFTLKPNHLGSFNTAFSAYGSGKIQFNRYGSKTFTGTLAHLIGEDASGNIIEYDTLPLANMAQSTLKLGPNLASNIAGDSIFLKKRVFQIASAATHTYNLDTVRLYVVTGQAVAATFANPTGATSNDGTEIEIRIKDNGGAQTIAWGTSWQGSTGLALPATTTAGKTMWMKFEYDAIAGKYDLISLRDGF